LCWQKARNAKRQKQSFFVFFSVSEQSLNIQQKYELKSRYSCFLLNTKNDLFKPTGLITPLFCFPSEPSAPRQQELDGAESPEQPASLPGVSQPEQQSIGTEQQLRPEYRPPRKFNRRTAVVSKLRWPHAIQRSLPAEQPGFSDTTFSRK